MIIPFKFDNPWVECAIQSVYPSEGGISRLVLVSDGAGEELVQRAVASAEEAGWIGRYEVVRLSGNGASAARNAGLDSVRTKYVLFLDSDDILDSEAVERALRYLMQNGLRACVCKWADIAAGGEQVRLNAPLRGVGVYASAIEKWWPVSSFVHECTEVRFDEALSIWEVLAYQVHVLNRLDGHCGFSDELITSVRHHQTEGRASILYDHFDPERSFQVFAMLRTFVNEHVGRDRYVDRAFDENLLGFSVVAARLGRLGLALKINRTIDGRSIDLSSSASSHFLIQCLAILGPLIGTVVYVLASRCKNLLSNFASWSRARWA